MTACIVATLNAADQHKFVMNYATRCRALTGVKEMLPIDAHDKAMRARVHIGVTTCETGNAALLSTFNSRQALVDATFASCKLPRSLHPLDLWRGRIAFPAGEGKQVDGASFVDGALSNLCPTPAGYPGDTLRVSPFAGPGAKMFLSPSKPATASNGWPNFGLGSRNVHGLPVYLCLSNVHLLQVAAGASPRTLERLYDAGRSDAERYIRDANW